MIELLNKAGRRQSRRGKAGSGQPRLRRSLTRRRVSTKASVGSSTAAAGVARAGAAASTAGRSKAENTSDSSSVRAKESAPSGGNRKGRGVGAASAEAGHEDVKAVTPQGVTLARAQKRAPTALWAAGALWFSPAPPTGVGGVSGGD